MKYFCQHTLNFLVRRFLECGFVMLIIPIVIAEFIIYILFFRSTSKYSTRNIRDIVVYDHSSQRFDRR